MFKSIELGARANAQHIYSALDLFAENEFNFDPLEKRWEA